jgi:lysophospholipase L1-like esterase
MIKFRLTFFYLFYLVLSILLLAQNDIPLKALVNSNLNKLKLPTNQESFQLFFRKLDSVEKKMDTHVNIVHFGGSHIQAGFWTEVLMKNFHRQIADDNPIETFIFPFRAGSTNEPSYYRTLYRGKWDYSRNAKKNDSIPLAASGAAIITSDTNARVGFDIVNKSFLFPYKKIGVYFDPKSSYELKLNPDIKNYTINKVSTFYTEFVFGQKYDSIFFNINKKDSLNNPLVLYGFAVEDSLKNIGYYPFGVNGASSSSFLKCEYLKDQLLQIKPDLVILSLGVNDAFNRGFSQKTFEKNYDSLIKVIRSVSPKTAILINTINDHYSSKKVPNINSLNVRNAIYDLQKKHDIAIWDMFEIMGGLGSIKVWQKFDLAAKDKIHFKARGYYMIGKLMFDAINDSFVEYKKGM